MTGYSALFEFTDTGLDAFNRIFTGQLDDAAIDLSDTTLATRIAGTTAFDASEFATAKDMATAILAAVQNLNVFEILPRKGLWAWLTFVLRDQLFKRDAAGIWKVGEMHRWFPSDPNDWQKGQRHLVRMPVLLLSTLGDNADHLLCGRPGVLPEIREQLTSQQDMFNPAFQQVARTLYYDSGNGGLKRGAGGKGGGSPRRLAKVRQQLDVTWDIESLQVANILATLPGEFDRFKAVG